MTRIARLQERIAEREARMAEIVSVIPNVATIKSYSAQNSAGPSHTNQDFRELVAEYRQLRREKESMEDELDALQGSQNSGSYALTFREPGAAQCP